MKVRPDPALDDRVEDQREGSKGREPKELQKMGDGNIDWRETRQSHAERRRKRRDRKKKPVTGIGCGGSQRGEEQRMTAHRERKEDTGGRGY